MTNETKPLTIEERRARAQYFREWRAKNKEKVRIYNQRYWQKRAAKGREEINEAISEDN